MRCILPLITSKCGIGYPYLLLKEKYNLFRKGFLQKFASLDKCYWHSLMLTPILQVEALFSFPESITLHL